MAEPPPEPAPPAAPERPRPLGPPQSLGADLPQPRIAKARRWNVSLVWLVPAVAVAIGASLLIRTVFLVGPRLTIEFASAEGVEAGKTEVRYKEVVIGKVHSVLLRGDRKAVVVGVQLDRTAASIAVADTTFWVVRPRIGLAGVSGLGTLLSGAYIGTDAGVSTESQSEFKGLEQPPLVLRGEPGSIFVLRSDDLGSLDVGSAVFHLRTRVGRVVAYTLDPNRDELLIKVFVEAPYQKLVTTATRFWNASGIDLTVSASGLTLNTQTLASVLAGGLAFETPGPLGKAPRAPDNSVFRLYNDRRTALAPPDGTPVRVRMIFDSTVRGLVEGAAVDFLGIEIGRVSSVSLQYDAARKKFPVEVHADIYPLRLGPVRAAVLKTVATSNGDATDALVLQQLVGSGLRAQLRTGNLLTGQLYVALDFIGKPSAPIAVAMSPDGAMTLPTAPGTLAEIQPQIADIVAKVSKIPFDEIGKDLRATLAGASQAIGRLTPEAQRALADVQKTLQKAQTSLDSLDRNITDANAPVQHNLEATLLELQRASRSLRVLADYLQQHPESLLRGKPADPAVPSR
ncbi:MAG: MlaD family protein [Pseudomonadota bacterium]|nr:MlaD family protein [Pseudomonadota bacterium]